MVVGVIRQALNCPGSPPSQSSMALIDDGEKGLPFEFA
jgi:hypothetical protein